MSINQRLKKYLDLKEVSQTSLAADLLIKSQAVSNWFNNNEKIPPKQIIRIIELNKDVNARWLITGEGEMLSSDVNDKKSEQGSDNGKDLLPMLLEKTEECGVLRTQLEHAKEEIAKLHAGGQNQEPAGEGARAG